MSMKMRIFALMDVNSIVCKGGKVSTASPRGRMRGAHLQQTHCDCAVGLLAHQAAHVGNDDEDVVEDELARSLAEAAAATRVHQQARRADTVTGATHKTKTTASAKQ